MAGMKSTLFTRAIICGLITVGVCIAGNVIPFRPEAVTERAWGMGWAIAGMTIGVGVARILAKDRSAQP